MHRFFAAFVTVVASLALTLATAAASVALPGDRGAGIGADPITVSPHGPRSPHSSLPPCATSVRTSAKAHCSRVQGVGEGGCGFLQRCLYLSRSEQSYLVTGGKWVLQVSLCSLGLPVACVVLGLAVELAYEYLHNRGGICPTTRPKLEVQYLPWIKVEGCTS